MILFITEQLVNFLARSIYLLQNVPYVIELKYLFLMNLVRLPFTNRTPSK